MGQQDRNPDHISGRDLPDGDGNVSDEQVQAIDDDGKGKPTGQDHSTERDESMDSEGGVGVFQDSSQPASGRGLIDEE